MRRRYELTRTRLVGLESETLADMTVAQFLTMKASKCLARSEFLVGVTAELSNTATGSVALSSPHPTHTHTQSSGSS